MKIQDQPSFKKTVIECLTYQLSGQKSQVSDGVKKGLKRKRSFQLGTQTNQEQANVKRKRLSLGRKRNQLHQTSAGGEASVSGAKKKFGLKAANGAQAFAKARNDMERIHTERTQRDLDDFFEKKQLPASAHIGLSSFVVLNRSDLNQVDPSDEIEAIYNLQGCTLYGSTDYNPAEKPVLTPLMFSPQIFENVIDDKAKSLMQETDIKLLGGDYNRQEFLHNTNGKAKPAHERWLMIAESIKSPVKFQGKQSGMDRSKQLGAYYNVGSRLTNHIAKLLSIAMIYSTEDKLATLVQLEQKFSTLKQFIRYQHQQGKLLPRGSSVTPMIYRDKEGHIKVELKLLDIDHATMLNKGYVDSDGFKRENFDISSDVANYDLLKKGLMKGIDRVRDSVRVALLQDELVDKLTNQVKEKVELDQLPDESKEKVEALQQRIDSRLLSITNMRKTKKERGHLIRRIVKIEEDKGKLRSLYSSKILHIEPGHQELTHDNFTFKLGLKARESAPKDERKETNRLEVARERVESGSSIWKDRMTNVGYAAGVLSASVTPALIHSHHHPLAASIAATVAGLVAARALLVKGRISKKRKVKVARSKPTIFVETEDKRELREHFSGPNSIERIDLRPSKQFETSGTPLALQTMSDALFNLSELTEENSAQVIVKSDQGLSKIVVNKSPDGLLTLDHLKGELGNTDKALAFAKVAYICHLNRNENSTEPAAISIRKDMAQDDIITALFEKGFKLVHVSDQNRYYVADKTAAEYLKTNQLLTGEATIMPKPTVSNDREIKEQGAVVPTRLRLLGG